MINTNINSQTVQDCLLAVDAHDLDRVRKCYAVDAQIVAPGAELHGADQIMAWYQVFVTAFPDIQHEARATIQEGPTCVLQARVAGTHTGPLASPAGEIPSHRQAVRTRLRQCGASRRRPDQERNIQLG